MQINPVIQRIWVVCAACWPLAWIVFMSLSPGSSTLPPAPGTDKQVTRWAAPPVDTYGSEGMLSTSEGVHMFWRIPEPGKLEASLEIDPGVFTDDPLAFGPEGEGEN